MNTNNSEARVASARSKEEDTSARDKQDLVEWIEDTVAMLVYDPEDLRVEVGFIPGNLNIHVTASRETLAMMIGRGGETIRALHRLTLASARRAGFQGRVNYTWPGN